MGRIGLPSRAVRENRYPERGGHCLAQQLEAPHPELEHTEGGGDTRDVASRSRKAVGEACCHKVYARSQNRNCCRESQKGFDLTDIHRVDEVRLAAHDFARELTVARWVA